MSHTCHAKNCKTNCKPEYLMCPKHWRMVPKKTQLGVWKFYQAGQCEGKYTPSPEWHASADVAIAQVAQKEGFISEDTLKRIYEKARSVLMPK